MCHSMTFSWSLRRVADRVLVRYELGLLLSVSPGFGRKIPFDSVHYPGTFHGF